jgi:hypothetical protein
VVKPQTKLAPFLTGRLGAALFSLGFAILATAILIWQIIVGSWVEITLLLAAAGISAIAFMACKRFFTRFLFHPFDAIWATRLATIVVTPVIIAAFYHFTWAHAQFPGEFLNTSFTQAMWLQPHDLPERDSALLDVFSIMQVQTATKLWLVAELKEYPIAARLFSLDNALFALIATRSFVLIASYMDARTQKSDQ